MVLEIDLPPSWDRLADCRWLQDRVRSASHFWRKDCFAGGLYLTCSSAGCPTPRKLWEWRRFCFGHSGRTSALSAAAGRWRRRREGSCRCRGPTRSLNSIFSLPLFWGGESWLAGNLWKIFNISWSNDYECSYVHTRNIDIENVGGYNPGQLRHIVLPGLLKPFESDPVSRLTFPPGQIIRLKLLTKTRPVTDPRDDYQL